MGVGEKNRNLCLCLSEYFLEDSDLEGLSDITVSSVHTSDLSSFEGESENEEPPSDSSEEGELPPDGLNFLFIFVRPIYQSLKHGVIIFEFYS